MSTLQSPSWIAPLARFGHAAKGIVYVVVGVLAVMAAAGGGGEVTGSGGALEEIASKPFGKALLVVTGLGLAAYAVFRLLAAVFDTENKGEDGKAVAKRVGYFASGVAHAALAWSAFSVISGGSSGEGSEDKWTAKLMAMPAGPWLVGAVGLAVIAAGIFQWVSAKKGSFKRKFTLDSFAAGKRQWIERIATAGYIARGVVFAIIGYFLIQAAVQSDPSEARGLGGALHALAGQSYGMVLLGVTAAGLACYGLYCWVLAIYGDFGGRA